MAGTQRHSTSRVVSVPVLVAVLGYLRDVDRQFQAPNVQVQLSWVLEKDLKKQQDAVDQMKTAMR